MAYRHINHKSMLVYAVVMLAAYTLTLFIPVGWGTYALALPAYIISWLTCVSRANHLIGDTKREDARRFGLAIFAGLTAMVILEPVWGSFPKFPIVFGYWAIAIIWMTTEGMPPWWDLVSGAWNNLKFVEKCKLFVASIHGRRKEPKEPQA